MAKWFELCTPDHVGGPGSRRDNGHCYIAGIFSQQRALPLVTSRSHDI